VLKKKEIAQGDLKAAIVRRDELAKQLSEKESQYADSTGHKYMKKDEFKKY
jgi:hypothetical protein